ncbi:MAG: biotin/lipoyl-binding protein [Propionibacteriaceae bacterium]|nr:biotin/lipoyl-binding protein [Propionibacteriaceae bacterium]
MKLKVTVNQVPYEVDVEVDLTPSGLPALNVGGVPGPAPQPHHVGKTVTAPLAGSVRKILVQEGQTVAAGDVVAILEAMKMETEIQTAYTGVVGRIFVEASMAIQGGDPIVEIDQA